MDYLKNKFSNEIFYDLEKAKKYYYPCTCIKCIGSISCIECSDYKKSIIDARSLTELAYVLNKYSDNFGNVSEYVVIS